MDHKRVILPVIYISVSQTLSIMILSSDFFHLLWLMVKINYHLRENSVLIVPPEEKVVRRPQSTFQYLQVPTRKPEQDSASGTVVRGEGVVNTNCKRGNLS